MADGRKRYTRLARHCLPLDLGYALSVRSLIPTVQLAKDFRVSRLGKEYL